MFTGLIEEVGTVVSIVRQGSVHELTVTADTILEGMSIGDSISISGVCQTVTSFDATTFHVQAVTETIERTTFGLFTRGTRVNLERALRVGDRLGGHFVQGHVESRGKVTKITPSGEGRDFRIQVPASISRYIVEKGSITVDGISLTVTMVSDSEFGISVIPHTVAATTLHYAKVGDLVNIETDIIGKYIDKFTGSGSEISMNTLYELGYE